MKQYFHRSLVVIVMIALSCGDLFAAATTAGMLRSNGGVSVNGSPVTPLMTVFSGDRIETAPQAEGSLTVGGNSLLLDPNSSLVFHGQDVDFYCGGGTIQAGQGMSARYGETLVKPSKDSARYQVQQSGVIVKISALQGDLMVSQGANNFNLAAGNSMNVSYKGCAQVGETNPQDAATNGSGGGLLRSAQNPGSAVTVPASRASLTALMVVGAVATAGIIAVSRTPISSSAP